MKRNGFRMFLVLWVTLTLGMGPLVEAFLPASPSLGRPARAEIRTQIPEKAESAFVSVSGLLERQVRALAQKLTALKNMRLEIRSFFYDRKLHRIFFEFRGEIDFTGKLTSKMPIKEGYYTADGEVAFDLAIERVRMENGGARFGFHGDVVLFLDLIVYELAKDIPQVIGSLAVSPAAGLLVDFLSKLNLDLVARAISTTIGKFSVESLSTLAAEVTYRATHQNNLALAKMVKDGWEKGSITSFFVLTIIKTSAVTVANLTGSTLGGIVGNLVAPGAGGVVGAYLGGRLFGKIMKKVVFFLTSSLPVERALKKLVYFHGLLAGSPGNPEYAGKFGEHQKTIFDKIKTEIDGNRYRILEESLDRMEGFSATEKVAFVPLLKQIQELLRFNLLEKGDWYAAKKYHQLKQGLQTWGLADRLTW